MTMEKTGSWMSLSKRVLGFATTYGPDDDDDPPSKKACIARDRLTHRVIEKKRRDRMNNCLADLSQLIPPGYLRQGQGRIEKTEVIEMAIKHIETLQQLADQKRRPVGRDKASYQRGFKACQEVVIEFLVDIEGCSFDDAFCARLVQKMQSRACELPEDLNATAEDEMRSQQNAPQRFGSVTDAILYRRHSEDQGGLGRDDDAQLYMPMSDPARPESGYVSDYVTDPRLQPDCGRPTGADCQDAEMVPLDLKRCSPQDAGQMNGGAYKFKNDMQNRFTPTDAPPPPPAPPSSSSSLSSLSSLASQYWPRDGASGDVTKTDKMAGDERRCCGPCDRRESAYCGKLSTQPATAMPPLIGVDQDGMHYPVGQTVDVQRCGDRLPDIGGHSGAALPGEHSTTVAGATDSVPGFALHPSGSFYLPVAVPRQALAVALLDDSSSGLCHPVNIHVRFGVPKPLDGNTERHSHLTPDGAPIVARSCDESREISRFPSNSRAVFEMQRNVGNRPYITTG